MHRRLAAVAAALLVTLFAASACGGLTVTKLPSAPPTKASPTPTGTGTGGAGPTAAPTATTYPATAQAYGEKTLAVWGGL
jgi:hypothetical protein